MALKPTDLDTTVEVIIILQRVVRRGGCNEAYGVTRGVAASSEDLGCSSNYSSENLDDRSG